MKSSSLAPHEEDTPDPCLIPLFLSNRKYTEPPYPTVQEWLGYPPSENRTEVLEGWFDLIEEGTDNRLYSEDVFDLDYQMIHLTASACYPDGIDRYVIYQCFDLDEFRKRHYTEQLSKLSRLIDSPNLSFYVLIFPLIKSAEYKKLERLWDTGVRDLSNQVKEGFKKGKLLRFGKPEIVKIC